MNAMADDNKLLRVENDLINHQMKEMAEENKLIKDQFEKLVNEGQLVSESQLVKDQMDGLAKAKATKVPSYANPTAPQAAVLGAHSGN
jgi:hypothetical protein